MCEIQTTKDAYPNDATPDDEWKTLRDELNAILIEQSLVPPSTLPDAAWTPNRRAPSRTSRRRRDGAAAILPPEPLPQTERLSVTTARLDRDTIVTAEGDIDAGTAPVLRQALRLAVNGADSLELVAADLRASHLCDGAVWPALIEAHQRLALQGRRLFVILVPGSPTSLCLSALGLDTLLTQISAPGELRWLG